MGAVKAASAPGGEQMVPKERGRVNGSWRIRVLYDGDCPLCSREIRFLERRDRGRGRIRFEDIAEPSFDPGAYGLEAREVMARIHGVLPDGTVIAGMEVFRQAYAAVGLGWLMAPTGWPGLRRLADLAYRIFARNRLRLTGRTCSCEARPPQEIGTRAEARPPSRA
jgi:predicted DCC family thiol-disulfide oxidoreductase YuxK